MSEEKSVAPSWTPHKAQGQEQAQDERAALERRMLTGGPFVYGELCKWRAVIEMRGGRSGDDDRLIDRTIQKLRRRGLIDFKRAGRLTVWNATPAALAESAAGHIPSELAQDGARTHSPNVERGER